MDTTITRSIYDSLPFSWRAPDTLASGAEGPAGRFKQLHVLLKDAPLSLTSLVQLLNWDNTVQKDLGDGAGDAITSYLHPDSCAFQNSDPNTAKNMLQFRVYSTYRATVRVRSLTFQDTIADKYLHRIPKAGGGSIAVKEDGTTPGGFDHQIDSLMGLYSGYIHGANFELQFNDTRPSVSTFSQPVAGLLEYLGAPHHIWMHYHQQDHGNESQHFRRECRAYGIVPSMFENEKQQIGPSGTPILPRDYVYYAHSFDSTLDWPSTPDSLMGLLVTRKTPGDTLEAYKDYMNAYDGQHGIFSDMRASARVGMWHPDSKKMAIEANIPTWGILHKGTYKDSETGLWVYNSKLAHYGYNLRFPTPEEIKSGGFVQLANGILAFNDAQAFQAIWSNYREINEGGLFHLNLRSSYSDSIYWLHDFNVGHDRMMNIEGGSNDADGTLPNYYLGYSNTYKAIHQLISRVNAIYDSSESSKYPLKRLRWLDSYDQQAVTTDDTDAAVRSRAFLKIDSTVSVDAWNRDHGNYIDRPGADSAQRTYVSVGLFRCNATNASAALVINTRLYPSYRDSADLAYYNDGLDSISRIHTTLGDIDVRKVFMHLDDTTLPTGFEAKYYVVRDLWHPDSTWLVKSDSEFAVYLKPGDAKFLYFEKGVAIDAAKRTGTDTGSASAPDFCFNNGHRIAERMNATREVIAYTRNNKLYVSYPSKGAVIPGYAERSAGDNIATGYEQLLDSVNFCAKPSVCTAQNDTAVALTYCLTASGTPKIAFAYQPHPDSAWKLAICPFASVDFSDTSSDHRYVTPVLTPYNDTTWLIAAGSHNGESKGVFGFMCRTVRGHDPQWELLANDTFYRLAHDKLAPNLFPTLASAPLPDSMWPIRIAYQYGDDTTGCEIKYNRMRSLRIAPEIGQSAEVSVAISACDNKHPSIAFNSTRVNNLSGGGYTEYYDDNVSWDALLRHEGAQNNYWPVARARHQVVAQTSLIGIPPVGKNWWGSFDVFRNPNNPVGGPRTYHYPQFSAASRKYDGKFTYNPKQVGSSVYDWLRIGWTGESVPTFASWIAKWKMVKLADSGFYPSIPEKTDSFAHWTDSSSVPRTIAYTAHDTGTTRLRVTNGLFPYITYRGNWSQFLITPRLLSDPCAGPQLKGDLGKIPSLIVPNNPKLPTTTFGPRLM